MKQDSLTANPGFAGRVFGFLRSAPSHTESSIEHSTSPTTAGQELNQGSNHKVFSPLRAASWLDRGPR